MNSYFDCWIDVATTLFSQALAGEPELVESLPKPLAANAPPAKSEAATDAVARTANLRLPPFFVCDSISSLFLKISPEDIAAILAVPANCL